MCPSKWRDRFRPLCHQQIHWNNSWIQFDLQNEVEPQQCATLVGTKVENEISNWIVVPSAARFDISIIWIASSSGLFDFALLRVVFCSSFKKNRQIPFPKLVVIRSQRLCRRYRMENEVNSKTKPKLHEDSSYWSSCGCYLQKIVRLSWRLCNIQPFTCMK